jgi:branched-chain amino acid transport system permease protein
MKKWLYFALLILACILPIFITSRYYMHVTNTAIVFLIIVMGLNYVIGFSGQISLASTAFWGIGAYTSALLTIRLGIPFWVALPVSAFFAIVAGLLIGFPTLKLKLFYLGIATVGFGEIIALVFLNWTSLTNGADGIPGIPNPRIGDFVFNSDFRFYYILLACAVFLLFVSIRLKNSRFGRALLAINNNEIAAESFGINAHVYKMAAFALSAFYAGIAGSLYAHLIGYISPDLFVFRQSIVFLCMYMIGGAGYIAGPIIGSVLLTVLPELMRFFRDYYMAFYGLLVVVLAIGMPTGISGLIEKYIPSLYSFLEPYAEIPKRINSKIRGKK